MLYRAGRLGGTLELRACFHHTVIDLVEPQSPFAPRIDGRRLLNLRCTPAMGTQTECQMDPEDRLEDWGRNQKEASEKSQKWNEIARRKAASVLSERDQLTARSGRLV